MNEKTPKESLAIQSALTDSIQKIWFKFSNELSINSNKYALAHSIYTKVITKAQIEIMNKSFK